MTKFTVNNRTVVFFTITSLQKCEILVSVRLLTMKISHRAHENIFSYCKKAFDRTDQNTLFWKNSRHFGIAEKFISVTQKAYYNRYTPPFSAKAALQGYIVLSILFLLIVNWTPEDHEDSIGKESSGPFSPSRVLLIDIIPLSRNHKHPQDKIHGRSHHKKRNKNKALRINQSS